MVLAEGQVVANGRPEVIQRDDTVMRVYLGEEDLGIETRGLL